MARVSLEFYMVVIVACVSVLALLFLSFGGVKSSDLYGHAVKSTISSSDSLISVSKSKDVLVSTHTSSLDHISHLAPFPTKSSKSHMLLKSYGVVDSANVDLQGFYLLEGEQTQVTSVIQDIANSIQTGITDRETVENILDWTSRELYCSKSESDAIRAQVGRYGRTAEDVVLSGCACGCTDYTHAFVAIARAKGIPATVLETISERWLSSMVQNQQWDSEVYGHFYSEVYLEDEEKWDIVDPTKGWFTAWDEQYVLGPIPPAWNDLNEYYSDASGVGGAKYLVFERALDSWNYGIHSEDDFKKSVSRRYFIPLGQSLIAVS